MNNLDNASFVERLVKQFFFLQVSLDNHFDQHEELLPHVFFGDVTRLLIRMYSEALSERKDLALVENVLTFLDQSFSSCNDEVKELLSVSFLENLPIEGEVNYGINALLGPALKSELARIRL